MKTIAELRADLDHMAELYGENTPVYIDAPGITTPDVVVKHAKIGCDRVHLTSNWPEWMRMR